MYNDDGTYDVEADIELSASEIGACETDSNPEESMFYEG